ncbi:MAG: AraC family transcriptional regulator [Bacteroidota bacterium]
MEYVFEKIQVPQKHSFISREIQLAERLPRIHSHKNFELNYIVSGAGRRIVGDHISSFEKNDLVLLGPEIPHSWEILESREDASPSCITTHFYENIISSDFFNIPELQEVEELLKRANRGISFKGAKIKKIRAKLERLVKLDGLASYIELLNVFHDLLRVEEVEYLASATDLPAKFTKDLDRINSVYEYVFLNIEEGIRLENVAGLLHMAPGSFCRYFKKKTNRTFTQYVKGVRIGIAAKMLVETDKSITQICYESGYNNLANFNHYFKSLMNKTPSEYRKTFR